MNKVMVLRLLTGEDIIGTTESYENGIHITEPMSFHVNYRNNEPKGVLQLSHWLPVQMIKKNETVIKTNDILAVMEPDDQFLEYYINAVTRVKTVLEDQEELDRLNENQIQEIFDSMNNLDNLIIH